MLQITQPSQIVLSRFVSESNLNFVNCKYAYSYLLSLGIVKNIYSHVFRCTI